MAFLYVPNGVHMPGWTPRSRRCAASICRPILEPLQPVKDDLLVLSGLDLEPGACPRRRRRRSRPRHGQLSDRPSSAGRPTAPTSRPASPSTRWPPSESAMRPAFRLWRSAARGARRRANATTAIVVLISRIFRGGAKRRPSPNRSIPAWSSIGSSADRPMQRWRRRGPERSAEKEHPRLLGEDARQLSRALGAADRRKLDEYLDRRARARAANQPGPP